MAINFNSTSGGANITTDSVGSAPGGGGFGLDTSFFDAMARRAADSAERRRKEALEEKMYQRARLEAQDKMQRGDYNERMRERADARSAGSREGIRESAGPGTQLTMDPRTGQWSNWVDPIAAERFNTGKALPGRSAFQPGRKDDWNISSLQYNPDLRPTAQEETEASKRKAREPDRMTPAQAGWGLG